jgi:hypothetical protein
MTHLRDTPEWKESEAWDRINDCAYWTMAITGTANSFHLPCERDLLDLLQRFWLSEATDARDKVYALLGLATDNHPDVLVPNYSLSIGQVNGMSVKDVITRSKNLEIFSLCSSTGARRVEGLPTWAPNWRSQGKKSKLVPGYTTYSLCFINARPWLFCGTDPKPEKRRPFCASGEPNSVETVRFSEDFRELFLTGLAIDIISQLSEARSYEFNQEGVCQVWGAMGDTLPAYPRTLYADQFELNINALLVTPGGFQHCQSIVTSGRRFMLTALGFMGLAVMEAEVGDIVCLVKGSMVPVVLRVEDDHFIMVGEAYGRYPFRFQPSILLTVHLLLVHGAMYGEGYVWGESDCPERVFGVL